MTAGWTWNTWRVRLRGGWGEWRLAGRGICAAIVALAAALALSGCTSSGQPAPAATPARTSWAFAVAGDHPVPPNGSQDTSAATPGTVCNSAESAKDRSLGRHIADGFKLTGFQVAAALLDHFIQGKGTQIDYPAGSPISKQALASSAFGVINKQVQAQILRQLKAGQAQVRLSAAQLPTVGFESPASDLYWAFRGTQGLSVTGTGTGTGTGSKGRYTGTLTYVIRDSYGFPANDNLAGFGPPMRYLQTVCGAPQHTGGAHWFPDTITVSVPFDHP
jgi:hypothetical protein